MAASSSNAYDIIIVGGGTAGSVIARIVSDNVDKKILVLEAGPNFQDDPNIRDLSKIGNLLGNPQKYYFDLRTGFQPKAGNRRLDYILAREFGGGSSSNYALATKGGLASLRRLNPLGSKYWTLENIFAHSKRLETYVGAENPNTSSRGKNGPMHILQLSPPTAISQAIAEKLRDVTGAPILTDYNDNVEQVISPQPQYWVHLQGQAGVRSSTDYEYLNNSTLNKISDDEYHSKNGRIHLRFNATVDKVMFSGNVTRGVQYIWKTVTHQTCAPLVILSANVNDVKILTHSGIGSRALLEQFGIPAVYYTNNVGAGAKDQPHIPFIVNTPSPVGDGQLPIALFSFDRNERDIEVLFANSRVFPAEALFSSDAILNNPIITQNRDNSFYGLVLALNPDSNGRIDVVSKDPLVQVVLNTNLLSAERDMNALMFGLRKTASAVKQLGFTMAFPNDQILANDDTLKNFIRTYLLEQYHISSAVKMGTQATGVVDGNLNVYGVKGLKVADIMIFPDTPTSHTGYNAMQVGNIASEIILNELGVTNIHYPTGGAPAPGSTGGAPAPGSTGGAPARAVQQRPTPKTNSFGRYVTFRH